MLVSTTGFLILDNGWRASAFENSTSFLPGGAFPAAIAVEFQFDHACARPPTRLRSAAATAGQHRAEECPSFTLSFKHTPDRPTPANAAAARRAVGLPAPPPNHSPPRSRSSSRPRRKSELRQAKPKPAVKFTDGAAVSSPCKLFAGEAGVPFRVVV